jgi:hypothetical protein
LSLTLNKLGLTLILVAKLLLFGLFSVHGFLVWAQVLSASKFMQKKHFVSFSSSVLERSKPKVTGDRGKLLGERKNIEMQHESEGQICISLGVIDKLEQFG